MKSYKLVLSDTARKSLKKIDKHEALLLIGWMRKNLDGVTDPRSKGKALVGNLAGRWRYRVGDYRIIAKIEDSEILILVLDVLHRRSAYQ